MSSSASSLSIVQGRPACATQSGPLSSEMLEARAEAAAGTVLHFYRASLSSFKQDLARLSQCTNAAKGSAFKERVFLKRLIYSHPSPDPWILGLASLRLMDLRKDGPKINKMIKVFNSFNLPAEHRYVALRKAAASNAYLVVQQLLDVDSDELDYFVYEATLSAIRHGSSETIIYLLEEYQRSMTSHIIPIIYEAATYGTDVVFEQLSASVYFLGPQERGKALQLACLGNHLKSAQLLLEDGRLVSKADRTLALCKACEREILNEELVLLLLQKPQEISHSILVSLLQRCARQVYPKITEHLLGLQGIFSHREISEAKEIAKKFGREAIFMEQ